MAQEILNTVTSIVLNIRIMDILDIAIVAFAIYKTIEFIQKTRTQQIVKGLLILVIIMFVSSILKLYTVHFLLYNGLIYGFMAIIVIFYPELRRALEYIGRSNFLSKFTVNVNKDKELVKNRIKQICMAIDSFSSTHTGALIVIEREIALGDIVSTGTVIDADISAAMLETIFYEGTSLHDGAVILRDDKIHAAGCVLPLTQNRTLERTLGTRHRAGIGISEVSDALVLIVSEETGIISSAYEGRLSRFLDMKSVEKLLYNTYLSGMETSESSNPLFGLFRRKSNG